MRLLISIATLTLCFSVTLGCKKKDNGGGPSGPSGDGPTDMGDTDLSDGVNGPDGSDGTDSTDIIPPVGSLALDVKDAKAIGLAVLDDDSSVAIQEGSTVNGSVGSIILALTTTADQKLLTKIADDGSVIGIPLPDAGGVPPEIESVINAGEHGVVLNFTTNGYFPDSPAGMAWIKPDGSIVPFAPSGYTDGIGDFFRAYQSQYVNGKLWIHNVNQNALWSFDFTTSQFTKFTDDNQTVSGFLIPDDGTVYVQIRMKDEGPTGFARLRRVKPNGGFDEFETATGKTEIDDATVFKDRAIIYGQPVGVGESGAMEMSFLPERLWSVVSGASAQDKAFSVGDEWLVSYLNGNPFAFGLGSDLVAGNPLRGKAVYDPSGATEPPLFNSNIDRINAVHFDGANIVTLSASGGTVSTTLQRKLTYAIGRPMRVIRVFGEDHGFTGTSYWAYATNRDGELWWVEIVKETGEVKVNEALKVSGIADAPISDNASNFAQRSTVYNMGGTLVVLAQHLNGSSIFVLEDDGDDGLVLTERVTNAQMVGTSVINTIAKNHAAGVVYNSKLYYPSAAGIHSLTLPNTLTMEVNQALILPANTLGEDCSSDTRLVAGVFRTPTAAKPAAVVRLCSDGSNEKVAYATFAAWDFAAVDGTVKDLLETSTTTQDVRRFPEPSYLDGATDPAFLKAWSGKILLADNTTVDDEDVITTGLVSFGKELDDGDGIELASAWSDAAFLISGKTDVGQYESYRVDPNARAETKIDDLDGVQMYSASRIGDTFIVNGLRLSDNVRVTISYAMDGNKLGIDETSNIQIVQIVPFGE